MEEKPKIPTCSLTDCEEPQLPIDDPDWPFCSKGHHDFYAESTYGAKGTVKGKPSIEYIQKRLRQMGQEARLKRKNNA